MKYAYVLAFFVFSASAQNIVTTSPSNPTLDTAPDVYRSTTRIGTNAPSLQACIDAIKADAVIRAPGTYTYSCRPGITSITATVTAPPPCPAAPANETRSQTCPAGTTGTWTQVRTYSSAPQPTCWVAGEWLPLDAPAGACVTAVSGISAWPDTAVPAVIADADTAAVEVGVKFRTSVSGTVTAVRFYRSASNTARIVRVWSVAGVKLGEAVVPTGVPVGWVTVTLPTAVAVQAGTTYVASYHAPVGRYSADNNGMTAARSNGPLTMLANGTDGGNGVYLYGAGGFPTQTWQSSNYWVDVVFVSDAIPPPPPPTTTGSATLTWDAVVDARVTGYRIYWGTSPGIYSQGYGTGLLVTGTTYQVTGLPTGTTYYFAVTAVGDGLESSYSNEASKGLP